MQQERTPGDRDAVIDALRDYHLGRTTDRPVVTTTAAKFGTEMQASLNRFGTNQGADFTEDVLATTIWQDVRLEAAVMRRIPTVPMRQNVVDVPYWTGSAYTGAGVPQIAAPATLAELSASPDHALATEQTKLTAGEMRAFTQISRIIEEDSVVPAIAEVRGVLVDTIAHAMDDVIINGDGDATAGNAAGSVGNINAVGTSSPPPATSPTRLVSTLAGLRRICIAGTSGTTRDGAGNPVSADILNLLRGDLQRAGVNPLNHFFIVPPGQYYRLLNINEFQVWMNAATAASVLTGTVDTVGRAPVVLSARI